MEQAAFENDPLLQRGFKRGVDHFLARDCRQRCHRGDCRCRLDGFLDQLSCWNDPCDQARTFGLCGIHHPTSQTHLHRLGLTNCARQPLRPAHAGGNGQLDFRLPEFGIVTRNDKVRHHGQFTSTPKRKAVYSGDPWLAGSRHAIIACEEIRTVHIGKGLRRHFLDIRACGKGLFAAS